MDTLTWIYIGISAIIVIAIVVATILVIRQRRKGYDETIPDQEPPMASRPPQADDTTAG